MAKTDALIAGVKQYLADMNDDEFTALVNEVREPEPAENDGKTNSTSTAGGSVAAGRDRYNSTRGA
ncbi:MAG: hypothetical protein WBA05_17945 [Gordonia sp. (in: high G+C Gram-positive bacteria)]|uniref:hypothetical protein n=1 Tax=Gordonia sp. (in: high G+C Gram-positive bacteria) TaxID=84139 RepID=UPI003C7369A2